MPGRALQTAAAMARSGELPRGRLARAMVRSILRIGPKSGNEPWNCLPGSPHWPACWGATDTTWP